jgi:anti-sigma factor RsiW
MDCIKARRLLSASIDNQLKPDESEEFVCHLQACESCSRELKELFSIHELFESAERYQAPYGFATRVMANLEAGEPSWLWGVFNLRPFFLRTVEVAFALIIMIIGVISGNLLVTDRAVPQREASVEQSLSLDVFQATPPDSIAGIYVMMMGVRDER